MSNLVTCLETVVGLSDSDCSCYKNPPAGVATSLSGYYLTEQEEGVPLRFLGTEADCETGGPWDVLTKARNEGIRNFVNDLADANSLYRSPRNKFNGFIGNADDNGLAMVSRSFNVLKLVPYASNRDGWMLINAISLKVDTTGTYAVKIYSSEDLVNPLTTVNITALADTRTSVTIAEGLELPLYKQDCKLTYFITYDRGAAQAYNNTLHCGCGSLSTKMVGARWLEFVECYSMNVATIAELANLTGFSGGSHAYGLQVDVRIGCRENEWMCNLEYDFDRGGDVAKRIAKAIQLRSAINAISYIVQSRKIDRYTMLAREVLYGRRNGMRSQYTEIVNWIAANYPDENDCFECNQKSSKMVTAKL